MLCDVIGQTGADHLWRRECFRVVADHEKPLVLQSLWKPKDGFSRRFEIQLRASVEKQSLRERDTVTAGRLRPLPAPGDQSQPWPRLCPPVIGGSLCSLSAACERSEQTKAAARDRGGRRALISALFEAGAR